MRAMLAGMSDPDSFNPSLRPPAAEPGRPREAALPNIDVFEKGASIDGVPQTMDRRLYMQLLVFHAREGADLAQLTTLLSSALAGCGVGAVVYEDVNDPRGLAVLTVLVSSMGASAVIVTDSATPPTSSCTLIFS